MQPPALTGGEGGGGDRKVADLYRVPFPEIVGGRRGDLWGGNPEGTDVAGGTCLVGEGSSRAVGACVGDGLRCVVQSSVGEREEVNWYLIGWVVVQRRGEMVGGDLMICESQRGDQSD